MAIPPSFVLALAVLVYFLSPSAFRHVGDLAAVIISLAVIPTLAYPLAAVIPSIKAKGRSGSRSLAFVTSAVGYTLGTFYAFVTNATADLKFIFVGYILALAALTIFNKVFKLKASGHACGIFGPLLYAVYFLGIIWILPCLAIAAAVVWASVYRKSHTVKELVLGAACAFVGFFVSLV